MNRLAVRVVRLERGGTQGWRAWWRVPMSRWPDRALAALVNADQGWPGGYVPTDDGLRAALGDDNGEGGRA